MDDVRYFIENYLEISIKNIIFAAIIKNNKLNMPEISRFFGIVIYMYITDHQPPHFHVVYNEYECWITIKDGIITGSLPRRAAKMVFEWLDLHEEELMDNWNRLQNSEAPLKIEPLK